MKDEVKLRKKTNPALFQMRLDGGVREAAEEEAERLERSLTWVLNRKLREAYGLLDSNA